MVHKSIEAWASSLERPEEYVLVACGAHILNHYFSQLSYIWKKVTCKQCLKHKKGNHKMVMMYGDIDKSKERRNDLNLIIANLTTVITEWDLLPLMGEDDKDSLEKLVQDALKSALKLKGDI